METKRVYLSKYTLDEKNSTKGAPQSYCYPGHEPDYALNIFEIYIEEKTSYLKSLKLGQEIDFEIEQDIQLTVPNYKIKEDELVDFPVQGKGYGTITDIFDLDLGLDDEEYQEIKISLSAGYAEGL